jgi:holliday junction DNA helicase RuvA
MTVSGIGAKLAITILSGMAARDLTAAIRGNDLARLTKIPGVGKKTAERMALELRDKLPAAAEAAVASAPAITPIEEDVLSALVNLGYQRPAAEKAMAAIRNGQPGKDSPAGENKGSFDALFRESLAQLAK